MFCRLLASACLALLTAACSVPRSVAPQTGAVVYVIGRRWHTDIGLPVEEIAGPLSSLEDRFPGVRFLTFGFGERQFLMSRKVNFGTMLGALLPSRSALLMTALKASPDAAFGPSNVVALQVSQRGLQRIEAAIWNEFEHSPAGLPVWLAAGPYPGSEFHAADGTYDAFFTCNTWTADTLRAGGVRMPAFGVLFAGQVMGAARGIAARQASSSRD
jgi:uncharacterized protein (TIGR02117 family)